MAHVNPPVPPHTVNPAQIVASPAHTVNPARRIVNPAGGGAGGGFAQLPLLVGGTN